MVINTYGSCFCNKVQFKIIGQIPPPWNCYCQICTRLHGSTYATHTIVRKENLEWVCGFKETHQFESSNRNFRYSCKYCGSPLVVISQEYPAYIAVVYVAISSKSSKNLPKPIEHLFVSSKVSWCDITDKIVQYEKLPTDIILDNYLSK